LRVAPFQEAITGQSFAVERTELGQDERIEHVFVVFDRLGALLAADFFQVIGDSIADSVATAPHDAGLDQSLMLGPLLGGVLRLPEVQHLDAVGIERVVGTAERVGLVDATHTIAPCNPRSRCRAAVVAEVQTLRDFDVVGCAPYLVGEPRRPRFERRFSYRTGHERFSNFSLKPVGILTWIITHYYGPTTEIAQFIHVHERPPKCT
jgi:hypothetical protein